MLGQRANFLFFSLKEGRDNFSAEKREILVVGQDMPGARAWLHPVSRQPLLQSDMAKFMSFGGKNIKMSDNEVVHIKGFGEVENSLKLLGFRSTACLKVQNHVKLPQFLYPCEVEVLFLFVCLSNF